LKVQFAMRERQKRQTDLDSCSISCLFSTMGRKSVQLKLSCRQPTFHMWREQDHSQHFWRCLRKKKTSEKTWEPVLQFLASWTRIVNTRDSFSEIFSTHSPHFVERGPQSGFWAPSQLYWASFGGAFCHWCEAKKPTDADTFCSHFCRSWIDSEGHGPGHRAAGSG
jgi:hypothetical protein